MAQHAEPTQPEGTEERGTVAVNFDGVVCQLEAEHGIPKGPPFPGAVDALRKLKHEGYWILMFSARPEPDVRGYLTANAIPFDAIVAGPTKKPLYRIFLDERAITFDGDWNEASRQIRTFQPYWRRD
jgi:phosphoglycolate phosphatase-like HAD superfamily hydrolase